MEMLDGTIVTTAAPALGRSLGVPSTSISLVVSAYLVTLAVLIPASGWVAGRFGARPVFLTAIAIFTLASPGCAASTSLGELVGMRVLLGVGGALMVPVGRQVVLADTPKAELMRVISFLVWPALIAPVFAPLVGGLITDFASWHWIFLINVPLGALAFTVALRLITSPPVTRTPPLDRLGVALTCAGLGGVTYAADLLGRPEPNWPLAAALVFAAVLVLLAAVRHLLGVEEPLVNLRTMQIGTFRASISGSGIFWLAVGAPPFPPAAAVSGSLRVESGQVRRRRAAALRRKRRDQARDHIPLRALRLSPHAGRFDRRPRRLSRGGGPRPRRYRPGSDRPLRPRERVARSVAFTGYSTLALSDVPEPLMSDANIVQVTAQQLCSGLGPAAGAVALRVGGAFDGVPQAGAHASDTFSLAFLILAGLCLLATFGAVRLDRAAGDVLRSARYRRPGGDVPVER